MGLVLMYVLLPLVNLIDRHSPAFLRRKRWSRPIAILITYAIVIGVVAALLSGFLPTLFDQGSVLVSAIPRYYLKLENLITVDLRDWLDEIPDPVAVGVVSLRGAGDQGEDGQQECAQDHGRCHRLARSVSRRWDGRSEGPASPADTGPAAVIRSRSGPCNGW